MLQQGRDEKHDTLHWKHIMDSCICEWQLCKLVQMPLKLSHTYRIEFVIAMQVGKYYVVML